MTTVSSVIVALAPAPGYGARAPLVYIRVLGMFCNVRSEQDAYDDLGSTGLHSAPGSCASPGGNSYERDIFKSERVGGVGVDGGRECDGGGGSNVAFAAASSTGTGVVP